MKKLFLLVSFIISFSFISTAQQNSIVQKNKSKQAIKYDVSQPLSFQINNTGSVTTAMEQLNYSNRLSPAITKEELHTVPDSVKPVIKPESVAIEQTILGTKPPPLLIASFDGLGESFVGPQGTASLRNPSDNSLAVGRDHIVQIVNSRMGIFTKKGKKFTASGQPLYGPVETRNVFKGFGGPCESINNGDAVVRYDQLADRWLIVMPTFRKGISRNMDTLTKQRIPGPQPGEAMGLYQPPPIPDQRTAAPRTQSEGTYCMCYAISTTPDPLGSYYRYEFERELFPDYPRPTVWPDGYYTTTSTGDNVIERHAYVVDRSKMLKGEDAKEQSFIIRDVNFIINADLDGKQLPPAGSPSIMMATGGTQLKNILADDGIYAWQFHVNWDDFSKTRIDGPIKIPVAPYHYLGGGQLSKAVPQPDTNQHLDSQGDKLMARLVYRRIGNRESVVGVHSISTASGGGGVRWYEFLVHKDRSVHLYQQGTYAPDSNYRWMASAAIDGRGNIGIGYSFGGKNDFPGQRFAGRNFGDPLGVLTLNEMVLVHGEAAQTNTLRWEDYTQTAIDPDDDETIWYVGDYLKKDGKNYSTKIGAFKLSKTKK